MKAFLRRYSSLLRIATAVVLGVAAGALTRSPFVGGIAFVWGLFFFPRRFYGTEGPQMLNNAPPVSDSAGYYRYFRTYDGAGLDEKARDLSEAYDEFGAAASSGYDARGRIANPNELQRIIEQDD